MSCPIVTAIQGDLVRGLEVEVAILFRGPIRPSADAVAARITRFLESISRMEMTASTYLATWQTDGVDELIELRRSAKIDNLLVMKPLSDDEILKLAPVEFMRNGVRAQNVFRQYYLSKIALDVISSDPRFEYVIHTRTDIDVDLGPHLETWFDPELYCTVHTSFINDQFAVAPAHLMQAAWDYGSINNLTQLMEKAGIPEDVLQLIVDNANIKVVQRNLAYISLDPLRK